MHVCFQWLPIQNAGSRKPYWISTKREKEEMMADATHKSKSGRPVIFGEVLFDVFPDGKAVLGGAPFNVAWHLQGFGLQPMFISRIGADANGEKVLQNMREWGMDTAGIQQDPSHPTGTVEVALHEGQPTFTILPEQAYDYIDAGQALHTLGGETYSLLYHGSLIARSEPNRETLACLHKKIALPVFLDVNLRPPWWSMKQINRLLAGARWVKMNDEELVRTSPEGKQTSNTLEDMAKRLSRTHQLEVLMVTRGASGAFLVTDDRPIVSTPPTGVRNLVDTVGAGDAFSAVMIMGLIQHWPYDDSLRRAGEFAATVCQIRGATPRDRELYRRFRHRWHDS